MFKWDLSQKCEVSSVPENQLHINRIKFKKHMMISIVAEEAPGKI